MTEYIDIALSDLVVLIFTEMRLNLFLIFGKSEARVLKKIVLKKACTCLLGKNSLILKKNALLFLILPNRGSSCS